MPSTPTPNLLTDPGFLFWAPLGTAEPTNTVAGSVFTDAWPVAWINLGATADGSAFSYESSVEAMRVAELLDPVKFKTTERSGNISFALADITLANLKRVLNGGTLSVVSGVGATTLNSYTPPAPGTEVRSMIGWESLDATMRIVAYQCLQGGDIDMSFQSINSSDFTTMSATFNFEVPSSGTPFKVWSAGTARG